MATKPRYLTKSAFKTAQECPTKLSYLKKPEYWSTKQDNAFLNALAQGGFQVGALAKLYYPGGTEIDTLDYEASLARTAEALKQPHAVVYEAAFRFENCFVRVDVLKKSGNRVELIEVKAKSFAGDSKEEFWTKKGTIDSTWEPYLLDIAFQHWVAKHARPDLIFTPHLMLVDKESVAGANGINQRFFLVSDPKDPTTKVRVAQGTTADTIACTLLRDLNVESEVDHLLKAEYDGRTFSEHVAYLADHYVRDERIAASPSRACKTCEYRITPEKEAEGFKNGFKRCWTEAHGLKAADFERPFSFDIWKLHHTKGDSFLKDSKFFMDQLTPSDLQPKSASKKKASSDEEPGLSNTERQWLQVELARKKAAHPHLDLEGLKECFDSFTYPLHFIDFETSMVAIPFHKDRRPYEQIAFQFSHHVVYEDGRAEHKDEYLCFERGKFPNYEFLRALKKALETDRGTIFRYADHENTVLRQIRAQLKSDAVAPSDAEELCRWIDSITRWKDEDDVEHKGARCMVDLRWMVQKFFYHPLTRGSNSIKAVLPAVLRESRYLQEKYSKPVYGTESGVRSKNFPDHVWLPKQADGSVPDPYKSLPPIFADVAPPEGAIHDEDDEIAEGGAAMTAYMRMQFTEMPEEERARVAAALLRYCELDTFAMVLLWEYWRHELLARGSSRSVA